jgi:hypothetical protein
MPLRLNVTADDDIREQILTMVREQLRPLVNEAVCALITREEVLEIFTKLAQDKLRILDPYAFRTEIKKDIVGSQAYQESYKLLPDEGRKEAKEMIQAQVGRWIEAAGRDRIAEVVRDILKKAVVA